MKLYGLETRDIASKYSSKAAKYYRKKVAAEAMGNELTEKPPAKNVEEIMDRGMEKGKNVAKQAEQGIKRFGTAIDKRISDSGIKDKVKGWFKKE